jgi:tripartite-type tricarboxylate transporter receptor subunit TctC
MSRRSRLLPGLILSGLSLLLASAPARAADEYPTRSVRLIVDGPPGGINDIWARRFAQRMGENLKQTVIVDNRPGASGTIAAEALARSAPDGYTMMYGGMSPLVAFPGAGGKVRYDPARDFAGVALGNMGFPIVAVSPALGVKTFAEFIAKANARAPGDEFACGTGGVASVGHFVCEMLTRITGIRLRTVPYKGNTLAAMDVISGQIHVVTGFSSELEPFARQGQLLGIAMFGQKRLPKWPDTPTMTEAGYPFELISFSGFYVPTGTPAAIITRLNAAALQAMQNPQMIEWLSTAGGVYSPLSPRELEEVFRREREKWKKMSEETGIRVE